MDMDLVPVYADVAQDGGGVRIKANVAQNLGIRVGKVEKAALGQRLIAAGNVTFDERLLELVQARVNGYITRLYVKAPLEHVRRGQPLADILAPEWQAAQQEYVALLDANAASAPLIREAARQRLVVLGVPEATILAIDADRKVRPTTTIFAPIDGVVSELSVREGSAFMAGAPLFRINGLTSVWVHAQVPEAQVSVVPRGAKATAHAIGWPGETFDGRVIALLPEVDPETRTLTARVAFDNPQDRLAPGMYVSVEFAAPKEEPRLLVPSEAVIRTGERSVVVVAREGGGFDVANVTVGAEVEGKSAILSGLEEGQSVVVSGQFLIDSEASLKSTVTRLETAVGPPAAQTLAVDVSRTTHPLTEGTITAIKPDEITIAHEAVPTLDWPPMTMGFKRPEQGVPDDLKVGDRVSFSFTKTAQGGFQIESITPLDEHDASARDNEERPR
ncbi:MAG: efflux RND transporter periplasmic adaptor subunit [Steroidobacter sp.]|nr:efflux RND transporter periplasmic adaptor subunit [Steroidobacter sp.]